jgi:HK97 family phage major capsid protein
MTISITEDRITALMKKAKGFYEEAEAIINVEDESAINDDQWKLYRQHKAAGEEAANKGAALQDVMDKQAALATEENERETKAQEGERKRKQAAAEDAGPGEFDKWADYMKAIAWARKGQYDPRLAALEVKDMAGDVGASGGFLIPTVHETSILAARGEAALVRPRAQMVPMGSRSVTWPAVDHTGGAAGTSAFYGGVVLYWVEENTDITESQPSFKQIQINAHELAGYTEIPNGLLRDSAVSLEAFLAGPSSFGAALGWQEDYEAFRGDGAGKPLGIFNAPAKITVARNADSDFKFVDAVTMVSKMLLSGSPQWYMNQSVMPKLMAMVDAVGNNIWLPNAAGSGPTTLLGFPINWTEKLPALNTEGDVTLADFGFYLLGDRQQVTVDIDTSFKFKTNQTAFRIIEAIDGQSWLGASITLADGSTTVSPFVLLTDD